LIKAGTEANGVTPCNRKMLMASALMHTRSGLPITTHSSVSNQAGLLQQDVFEEMGIDLTQVIIGHCGDTDDLAYLERILQRGSFIGLDRFGLSDMLPDSLRLETVVELCRRGYKAQLLLSHDYCSFIDFVPSREIIEDHYPEWDLCHIFEHILPLLKEKGVSDKQIHTMLIDNPRRVFETAGAPPAEHG